MSFKKKEKKKVASFTGSILDGTSKLTNQDLLCDVHRFMSSAINLSTLSCKPEAFLTYPARGSDIQTNAFSQQKKATEKSYTIVILSDMLYL